MNFRLNDDICNIKKNTLVLISLKVFFFVFSMIKKKLKDKNLLHYISIFIKIPFLSSVIPIISGVSLVIPSIFLISLGIEIRFPLK